ncbi:MAG: Gfo/Idh/MocA family oxidoreductase [Kiritimatiellae bacterium]|nr:Gfo/Idh/MocA family oxidoreductase [Kiritimatiellia bacterium]
MNRREFIRGASAFGFPMIFSGCATAYRANETVQMAAIGCGGRPADDMRGLEKAGAKFVALCDVDLKRSEAMRKAHSAVPFFSHYRTMLDKMDRDIDAVLIGTPDHWHATMAVECLKRGKHVQCEKPLCQSFSEMESMLKAAKENPKLVTQAMNQGHAFDTIRDFREWIEAGLIGEVTEAHIWCPAVYSYMDDLAELKKKWEVPSTLDWNQWQGPVPHRPYYPKYCPGTWRCWTMYGCNTLGDWSCHLMDPIFWTFGFGLPLSVQADVVGSWRPEVHGDTFPKGVKTTFCYTKPDGKPFKLVWYDGVACKDVPKPSQYLDDMKYFPPYNSKEARAGRNWMCNGAFVYGTKGVIEYGHHGANFLRLLPDRTLEKMRADNALPPRKYERIPGDAPDDKPYIEFVRAVAGGPKVGSDFVYAGAMTQCSLLGVAALFDSGKKLVWNASAGRFDGSTPANGRLNLPRLSGW